MVEDTEKKAETPKEEKKDLLTKAWPGLYFEGICNECYFWCKGFTRSAEGVTLTDAVIAKFSTPRSKWKYEGTVTITGPYLIHPIIK